MKFCGIFTVILLSNSGIFVESEDAKNGSFADVKAKWFDEANKAEYTLWPFHNSKNKSDKVNVSISMYIVSLEELGVEYQNLAFSCYLRMMWQDPRLSYPGRFGIQRISQVEHFKEHIWIPDVFVANAREVDLHSSIYSDSGIRLFPNGTVLLSQRMRFDLHCPMNLERFPFDSQQCHIIFETYIHDSDHIELKWMQDGLNFRQENNPRSFTLEKISLMLGVANILFAKYHRLIGMFHLTRAHGHYVIYWFVPCVFMMFLAYIQLWLPERALGAKSTICASVFLSFFILMVTARVDVPKVGYITAIDQWFMVHMVFLVVAFLEVIVLHILSQVGNPKQSARFDMVDTDGEIDVSDQQRVLHTSPSTYVEGVARKVIWFLKFILPATYILFIAIYWGVQSH